jgi:hypothetical protein
LQSNDRFLAKSNMTGTADIRRKAAFTDGVANGHF